MCPLVANESVYVMLSYIHNNSNRFTATAPGLWMVNHQIATILFVELPIILNRSLFNHYNQYK